MRVTFLTHWFIVCGQSIRDRLTSLWDEARGNPGTSVEENLMWNAVDSELQAAAAMVQDLRALQTPDHALAVHPLRSPYRRNQVTSLISLQARPWSYASRLRLTVETVPLPLPPAIVMRLNPGTLK